MKAPERIQTARLVLRRPVLTDAEAIFRRYASDPVVTRYLSWPTHRTVADTQAFLAWDETEWQNCPSGSYLIFLREEDRLLGSTGLSFKTPTRAVTGYVFAQDAWGRVMPPRLSWQWWNSPARPASSAWKPPVTPTTGLPHMSLKNAGFSVKHPRANPSSSPTSPPESARTCCPTRSLFSAPHFSTSTPRQKATDPLILRAAGFGSG
jgi:hypothetical protein